MKAHIATKLTEICSNDSEPRRPAAAWELAVCYFSGFGVTVSFENCSHWLLVALKGGIPAARTFFRALNGAMKIECDLSLLSGTYSQPKNGIRVRGTLFENSSSAIGTHVPVIDIDLDEDSDTELLPNSESGEDPTSDDPGNASSPILLPDEALRIIESGTLDQLRDYLDHNPDCINSQDSDGNTPLLLAAKRQEKNMVDFLISQDQLDASIPNKSQHTILHFLATLDESTIRDWIPRLVKRKANIYHEALPTHSGNEAMMFSAGIRCCSLLNAILYGNISLLKSLLEACHSRDNDTPCRICEAGSRFRRILAISLSIFQADAIEILVAHVKAYRDSHDIDLSRIEVWAGHELLPLHKVPFNSLALAAMDLPESFFRAINYGDKYTDALEGTIRFLLTTGKDKVSLSYSMLIEAVARHSVDAVSIMLCEGRNRGFSKYWWMQDPIADSPLMESINLGSRETYQAFLEVEPSFFANILELQCRKPLCVGNGPHRWEEWVRVLFGKGKEPLDPQKHKHKFNHVQTALNIFVNASHQDSFFL